MPDNLNEGPGWDALSAREELAAFGEGNSIALFAAELILGVEDAESFAAESLTDSGNDKSCDLVAVMRESGILVIAQAYATKLEHKRANFAPANKAADLNTAVTWLLEGKLDGLPSALKDAATEARDALANGEIEELQLWSVHNCKEGANVASELDQARITAHALLSRMGLTQTPSVSSREIGHTAINELYQSTQLHVRVTETISFSTMGGFEVSQENWSAYCTSIQLSELRKLWKKHETQLLSPNVRDYLGLRKDHGNINHGIKTTARSNPYDFFIFNNGITALVHNYLPSEEGDAVTVEGFGIVNGGQTTGAIGTLDDGDSTGLSDAWVQIRFIKSARSSTLQDVVKYNNTQNKIHPSDFRSTDAIQRRLREEFEVIPDAEYRGARRGGIQDAIKRDRRLLPDNTVAQALAAFHGSPNLAHSYVGSIWEIDSNYSKFFKPNLTARHVVFCYSALRCVEDQKRSIMTIPADKRTAAQDKLADFFGARGGTHLLVTALGRGMETFLDRKIADPFDLQFRDNLSPAEAVDAWEPIVRTALSFSSQLKSATSVSLKQPSVVDAAISSFESLLEAVKDDKRSTFEAFAHLVEP
ncbi:AIPR family protein [Brachybacterium paraconglomeratum]